MLQRFPEKLHQLRIQRGVSQNYLARQLAISRAHLSQLERGNRNPGTEVIFKIADFFGVSVDALVLDELDLNGE